MHRVHGATSTSLIYEIPKTEEGKRVKVDAGLLDYFALVKDQLVFTMSAADVEDEVFQLSQSLMNKYSNLTLYTNMLNAHLHIFKRWVVDLLVEQKTISSIQGELIPFLVKCQWRCSPKYNGTPPLLKVSRPCSIPDPFSLFFSFSSVKPGARECAIYC